jgi:hypothetical protein
MTEKEKYEAAAKAQKERRAAIQARSDAKKAGAMEKRKASLTIPASNPASVKAKEEAKAKEAAKNKAAIDAQKQKRESIQADYDAKKESEMAKRRAKGLPATPAPKSTAQKRNVTYDYMKDADPIRTVEGLKPSSREPIKAKRKPVRTTSVGYSLGKNKMPSSTIRNDKDSRPSVPGIQKGPAKRKFTDNQIKIMEIMKKGKQADGTMSESAQRKIQAVRAKERASNEKAIKKSVRAGKFNKRVIAKSAK